MHDGDSHIPVEQRQNDEIEKIYIGRDTNLPRAENPSWIFARSGRGAERLVQEKKARGGR